MKSNKFLTQLDSAKSSADVMSLIRESHRPDAARRQTYSHMAFFFEHLVPPRGVDLRETLLYIKLWDRLKARGEAVEGTRKRLVAELQTAGAARDSA